MGRSLQPCDRVADIWGYTAFLYNVRIAHQEDEFVADEIPDAYALMSSLLDGIASNIDPPLALVKFEGDAAFAVASGSTAPQGTAMLERIKACYRELRVRLDEGGAVWACTCDACSRKDSLDLKFVVHHGDSFVQAVGSHVEVLGPDMNIAHRRLRTAHHSGSDQLHTHCSRKQRPMHWTFLSPTRSC